MPHISPQLDSFLSSRFERNKRLTLADLIQPIKHGATIPADTLVLMASGDRTLRLKVLEADTLHKGFSEPMRLNDRASANRVTFNYLLWYMSHDAIKEHLLSHAVGSVFLRVPRKVLLALPIPLPGQAVDIKPVGEVVLAAEEDAFSRLIADIYRDYRLNFTSGRFRTAVILAGAIAEVVLYQLLLESGARPKVLSDDRTLGLGKMLDYVRLLQLDQNRDFPMTHLVQLQKNRNAAVHAGLLVSKEREFAVADLACFDHIIKYFGI